MKKPDWTKAQKNPEILLVDLRNTPSSDLTQEIVKNYPSITVLTQDEALKLEGEKASSVKFVGFIAGSKYDAKIQKIMDKFPQQRNDSIVHTIIVAEANNNVSEYTLHVGKDSKALMEERVSGPNQSVRTVAKNIGEHITGMAEQTETILAQAAELKANGPKSR